MKKFQGFELGQLVMTRGVQALGLGLLPLLTRHASGDWGVMDAHDSAQNDRAVEQGDDRVFSAYEVDWQTIWIITEADRSVTTILLPDEY